MRDSASRAGGILEAPDVPVLARVDLPPSTDRGALSLFSANFPPPRTDSAARESLATDPAPSSVGWARRAGSEVVYEKSQLISFSLQTITSIHVMGFGSGWETLYLCSSRASLDGCTLQIHYDEEV